jgi:RNA polymerase sigma-70 factor (ECF subfamily)
MTDPTAEKREKDAEYEAIALPWLDDVYRFAVSLTRDPSNADDVVQETFLRAYRSWHTFQRGSDARKWLFTIARNVYLRSLERERRYVDIEEGDQDAMDAVASRARSSREGADAILSQIDLQPALRRALDELAEPYKSAVVLVDLEDQSYDEAAEVLGVPIGTVRSRLFRGRRILQDKLLTYARDANFSSVPGPASPSST